MYVSTSEDFAQVDGWSLSLLMSAEGGRLVDGDGGNR